jgi:hypothetical protein
MKKALDAGKGCSTRLSWQILPAVFALERWSIVGQRRNRLVHVAMVLH